MARPWPSILLKCLGCCAAGVFLAVLPTLYFRVIYPGEYDGSTGISWFVDTAFFAMIGFLVAYFGSFAVLVKSTKKGK
jgi:hypothetical protein